jgi:hypothetical protein
VLVGVSLLHAADSKTNEAAIRALILRDQGKFTNRFTDDAVFWSGAYSMRLSNALCYSAGFSGALEP